MTAEPLTLSELPALRALAEKATPGPWRLYNERLRQQFPGRIIEVQCDGDSPVVQWTGFDNSHVPKKQHRANAAFIAAARDALPRALDTIEAQAKTIAERDAEIALLEAKTAELRQALWPFAFEAGMWADHVPDDGRPTVLEIGKTDAENYGSPAQYSIGDLRRARAALTKEPQT